MMKEQRFLEQEIKYKFKNPELLTEALTHSSYSNEMKAKCIPSSENIHCNERMEFLGDSILSVIVSKYIFRTYPELPEGDLSRIRAGTVCEKALNGFACRIGLGDYLFLGHGEEITNGRTRPSILADAFEALLAALYLDGGNKVVGAFLTPYMTGEIELIVGSGKLRDYKTLLQQIIQQERGEILEYVIIKEYGPAHKRQFDVEARLNSNVIGKGTGFSKREAEQTAAKEALAYFGE